MKIQFLSLSLLLSTLFFSCLNNNFDHFSQSDTITYRFEFNSFDTIDIYGYFNVELKESPNYAFEIKMHRNLIKKFDYECNDTVLTINKSSFGRSLVHNSDSAHLTIYAPNYHFITFFGPAYVYSSDTLHYPILNIYFRNRTGRLDIKVNNRYLRVENWFGVGNYFISGKVKKLILYSGRLSNIYAEKTQADFIKASNYSLGDIYCTLKDSGQFQMELLNKGNIYLYGHPQSIDTLNFREGLGKLIFLEQEN